MYMHTPGSMTVPMMCGLDIAANILISSYAISPRSFDPATPHPPPLHHVQIGLDAVAYWLLFLAFIFGCVATALRILANLSGVVSGAMAFTVVIAVALSVVTTLLYLGASAADGTSAAIRWVTACGPSRKSRAQHTAFYGAASRRRGSAAYDGAT